jgi:hypothetical protein
MHHFILSQYHFITLHGSAMACYKSLSAEAAEIRILKVLPGKENDAIKCELRTVSLRNDPAFEALSYTWGDPNPKDTISVNGHPFEVTVNLELALRALREPQRPRVLWIDAICINQNDTDEKNIQIPLMGEIYRTASQVVVWLGASTPEIELAVSWVQTYVDKSFGSASRNWLKMDAAALVSDRARRERDLARLKVLQGYFEIFSFSYWTRMWTFQEYRLPRADPISICGNLVLRASELGKAQDAIHAAGFGVIDGVAQRIHSRKEGNLSKPENAFVTEVGKAATVLRQKSDESLQTINMTPTLFHEQWEDKISLLLYLLLTTAERACFDPRDKVYALYGMVPCSHECVPSRLPQGPGSRRPSNNSIHHQSRIRRKHVQDVWAAGRSSRGHVVSVLGTRLLESPQFQYHRATRV